MPTYVRVDVSDEPLCTKDGAALASTSGIEAVSNIERKLPSDIKLFRRVVAERYIELKIIDAQVERKRLESDGVVFPL